VPVGSALRRILWKLRSRCGATQTHHEQRRVDIAHDDGAGHLVAPVVKPSGQLRQGRQTLGGPQRAVAVVVRQHPVAAGEGVSLGLQRVPQGRVLARGKFAAPVVQTPGL
jgi:hypothetical protein